MPYVVFCVSPYPSLLLSTISTNFMKKPKLKKKLKPNGRKHHGKMPKEVTHVSFARLIEGFIFIFVFYFSSIFFYILATHTLIPSHTFTTENQATAFSSFKFNIIYVSFILFVKHCIFRNYLKNLTISSI